MWYAAIRYHRRMDPQQYILSDRARSGLTGGAAMSRNSKLTIGIATLWLAGVLAISAQDKYAVKVPNGLPFSDFKGLPTGTRIDLNEQMSRAQYANALTRSRCRARTARRAERVIGLICGAFLKIGAGAR